MEYVVYFIALVLIGITTYQAIKIEKSGNLNENAWIEIRVLAYNKIDQLMRLYTVRADREAFIKFVIEQIKNGIDTNKNLVQVDRDFWSEDKLTAIFRPVLNALIDKVEELKK
jgi:hypothetical protein